ncbi:methyl-accepting chemotaxis sensory transducer [Desulfovibrio sp. X2]|uniref:methyl-accepting chemotaxis protein n=1 Tax=Desulfovibrio sp. X2 TaxID=941449 RepID=UPI000358B606|nr:HAMP domain-containing methyl-accepting chemotaxis protein [Desulfovibrio sp. X2]EPR43669.1 methyl-accepting chemotaxis sensory transducer [Desulfovibrio sp. X2]
MSVRNRLFVLLGVALLAGALIFAASLAGDRLTSRVDSLRSLALDGYLAALQARRQEKNFLMRKEKDYVAQTYAHADKATEALQTLRLRDPDQAEACDKALGLLATYRKNFQAMSDIHLHIGLTDLEGLRGEFVYAARNLEAGLKDNQDKDVLIALLQMRRQEKNFLMRRDQGALDKMGKERQRLEKLIADASWLDDARRASLLGSLTKFNEAFTSVIGSEAQAEKAEQTLKTTTDELEPVLTGLREQYQAAGERMNRQMELMVLGIEVVAGVVLFLTILWIMRSVSLPLTALRAFSSKVADGDLDARLEGRFAAEFASLKDDIGRMVGQLKDRLLEVGQKERQALEQAQRAEEARAEAARMEEAARAARDRLEVSAREADEVATQVAAAAEQLAAMISQVSRGAEAQNERMAETATAMEEMNATVTEVARNAGSASDTARRAKDKALTGADMVKQAVAAIGQVSDLTEETRQGMDALGSQVESIGRIIGVINDIADQTNLLALNAAIEAARAGDAGRGFAVVADEVRKLAEKTMQATREVESSITSIQGAARDNIRKMNSAAQAVEQSAGLADSSGKAQEEILALMENNSLQAESIASAAEQQSAASEEINRAVEQVGRIASETSEGMAVSREAVANLAELAERLKDMMARMLAR